MTIFVESSRANADLFTSVGCPDTKLVVIPQCGHVSNLEQPERVNEAVREFCRANSPP